MRYFLHLAYNGASYCGWQRQPNALGVQQVIEDALTTVLRTPVPIVGAGRTDAGVHAACMYAHFDTEAPIADPTSMPWAARTSTMSVRARLRLCTRIAGFCPVKLITRP